MQYRIGVDEVGRGSLAGPVVVSVVLAPRSFRPRNRALGALKDSKKLTASAREAWADHFKGDPRVKFMFARVYPRVIERINISNAANLAALRAFQRLLREAGLAPGQTDIFLDGGLYLGKKGKVGHARTIIKADEKISVVKIASILAKVHRDDLMRRAARKYPAYGFADHKGYATRQHRAAIAAVGPSDIHRLTFLGKSFKIPPIDTK